MEESSVVSSSEDRSRCMKMKHVSCVDACVQTVKMVIVRKLFVMGLRTLPLV